MGQLAMQEVASDFMTEADPGHPGGFLEPSGGFRGLIHNGYASGPRLATPCECPCSTQPLVAMLGVKSGCTETTWPLVIRLPVGPNDGSCSIKPVMCVHGHEGGLNAMLCIPASYAAPLHHWRSKPTHPPLGSVPLYIALHWKGPLRCEGDWKGLSAEGQA